MGSDLFQSIEKNRQFFLSCYKQIRQEQGLKFGQSTIAPIGKNSSQQDTLDKLISITGFPIEKSPEELLRLMSQANNHFERQELDRHLALWLNAFILVSPYKSEYQGEGAMLCLPIDERRASIVNTGYGTSEPFYSIRVDDKVYTVNKKSRSGLSELKDDNENQVCRLSEDAQKALLETLPKSIKELAGLQKLTAPELRKALLSLNSEIGQLYLRSKTKPKFLQLEGVFIQDPESLAKGKEDNLSAKLILEINDQHNLEGIELMPSSDSFLEATLVTRGYPKLKPKFEI